MTNKENKKRFKKICQMWFSPIISEDVYFHCKENYDMDDEYSDDDIHDLVTCMFRDMTDEKIQPQRYFVELV